VRFAAGARSGLLPSLPRNRSLRVSSGISSSRPFHLPLPRPVGAKIYLPSTKPTPRGVVPSAPGVLSLGTPMCHRPSPACHHLPSPGPHPRSTLEPHPKSSQRADLQAPAAVYRGDAASRRRGAGGALPQPLEPKYRLFYLSAPLALDELV